MKLICPRMGPVLIFVAALLAAHAAPARADLPTVPNVVGMHLDEARSVLKKEGFTVKAVSKESWFPGEHLKVYRQTPRPGPLNRFGKTVTIWYFWDRTQKPGQQKPQEERPKPLLPPVVKAESPEIKEPEKPKKEEPKKEEPKQEAAQNVEVITPSVLGMDLRVAGDILGQKGLKLKVINRMSTGNRFLANSIANQDPKAGFAANKGDTVSVSVYDYLPSNIKGLPGG